MNTPTPNGDAEVAFASLFASSDETSPAPAKEAVPEVAEKTPTTPTSDDRDLLGNPREQGSKVPFHLDSSVQEYVSRQVEKRTQELSTESQTAKAELENLKKAAGLYGELYSRFDDPAGQLFEDFRLSEAIFELREDPTVRSALERINANLKSGKGPGGVNRMTTTQEPTQEKQAAPAADPRIDALLRERAESKVGDMLKSSPIQAKFHSVIADYVLSNLDTNKGFTSKDVGTVVEGFMQKYGWTKEDLVGSATPSKTATPPTGGARQTTPASQSKAPEKETPAQKEFKHSDDKAEALHAKLRSLLQT